MKSVSNHEDSVLEMLRRTRISLSNISLQHWKKLMKRAVSLCLSPRCDVWWKREAVLPLSPTQPDSIEAIFTANFQQMETQAFLRY